MHILYYCAAQILGLCGIIYQKPLSENNTLVLLNIGIALEWILYNKILLNRNDIYVVDCKWQGNNHFHLATHSGNTEFNLMPQHLTPCSSLLTTATCLVFLIFRYHSLVLDLGILFCGFVNTLVWLNIGLCSIMGHRTFQGQTSAKLNCHTTDSAHLVMVKPH